GVPGWRIVGTGDFNGDGRVDLIWQNDTTRQVTVWFMGGCDDSAPNLGGCDGSALNGWSWLASVGPAGWTIVGAADFNDDGHPDLLWQNDVTKAVIVWYMGGEQSDELLSWDYISVNGIPGWTATVR